MMLLASSLTEKFCKGCFTSGETPKPKLANLETLRNSRGIQIQRLRPREDPAFAV